MDDANNFHRLFRFTPVFDPSRVTDEWYRSSGGTGEFHIQVSYKPAAVSFLLLSSMYQTLMLLPFPLSKAEALTIDAFDLLKVIGKGSFGKVYSTLLSPHPFR